MTDNGTAPIPEPDPTAVTHARRMVLTAQAMRHAALPFRPHSTVADPADIAQIITHVLETAGSISVTITLLSDHIDIWYAEHSLQIDPAARATFDGDDADAIEQNLAATEAVASRIIDLCAALRTLHTTVSIFKLPDPPTDV